MVETETKIQRYPTYKDSGVEWLGEIPEHWKIERAKWLFIKNERPTRKEDEIVTCFRDGEVTLRSKRKKSGFTVALKEHGYQGIRKGDLVIHAMDAFAGAIGVSDSDGKATPVYSVCTERYPNTVNQYYYSYFLRSLALNGIILALAKGIRERSTDFRFSDFGELLLSFPPLPEQTKIAQFLDDKTTKIDEAIAIKAQQINLLKERKQILTHKAVTRGLDDSVPLKDSGVEWIGEIPEHWEIESFKNILIERNEKNNPIKSKERLSLSIDKGITLYAEKTTNLDRFKDDFSQYKLAYENDLVFNSMNMIVGAVGVSSYFGCISPVYYTYYTNLNNGSITKYYECFFKSRIVQSQLYSMGRGIMAIDRGEGKFNTVRLKVSRNDLRSFKVPFPSLNEITEIVKYIEILDLKTKTAINLKEQEISKLQEYKSSLINGVVTGKVRVC
ncbi:restriction endonuclease subunit S [Maribacter dokdonensis]|uniref:restriction endonuclease subunit S n=1 Tax=Maribacter dokdonensis TaxID=320912 RepID=UPI0007198E73|nr:restriction endonuclease subunit S [Maribacter dokdonensis]KSA13472.1 Type I restriction-modification system, specificity subunit S [Maribacter dokdonensis DSW-8]